LKSILFSRLEPGDVFTLAGRNLELVMIKDMTVLVRKSNAKKSAVPSWNGGRMPLSANLGKKLRKLLTRLSLSNYKSGSNKKRAGTGSAPVFIRPAEKFITCT
jgi:ATP-dependent Lhr-like helicase